jgi:hypothetical protein
MGDMSVNLSKAKRWIRASSPGGPAVMMMGANGTCAVGAEASYVQLQHSANGGMFTTFSDSRFPFLADMDDRQRQAFWRRRAHLLGHRMVLDVVHGRSPIGWCAEAVRVLRELEALEVVLDG